MADEAAERAELEALERRELAALEAKAAGGPPTPSLNYYAGIEDNGILNTPTDAAKNLGTAALQTAGAFALPEVAGYGEALPIVGRFAPQAVEGGAGVLKTLLGYLRNGIWSSAGDILGTEGAEQLDWAPESSPEDKLKRFATNAGIGTVLGELADIKARGANRLSYDATAAASDPQVQAAIRVAEGKGVRPESPLDKKVKFANLRSSDMASASGAELGANAGENAYEVALGDRFRSAYPEIEKSGILQSAKTPKEVSALADSQIEKVNQARAALVGKLDGSALIGIENLQAPLDTLNKRVAILRKTTSAEPLANAIEAEVNRFSQDVGRLVDPISIDERAVSEAAMDRDYGPRVFGPRASGGHAETPQPLTVRDAIDINKNLNEVRRRLVEEFNSANQAAIIKGDQPINAADVQASVEAISELQRGLAAELDSKLKTDAFSKMNDRQSALFTLREQADKFQRGIETGRAERPASRLVKSPGQQGDPSFAADVVNSGPKVASLRKLLNVLSGKPAVDPGLDNLIRIEESGPRALSNIQDLSSLNRNPARLTPSEAPLGGRAAQAGIAGATGINALYELGKSLGPQQAQAQSTPLPRDSQAILSNPQALVERVAEVSNGNPQLMQDVQSVLKEQNPAKQEVALMELSRMVPGLFADSPYQSFWNGRIMDPKEQAMEADRLKTAFRTKQVDSNYLARAMSALNADGSVVPPPEPQPVQPATDYPVMFGDGPRDYAY